MKVVEYIPKTDEDIEKILKSIKADLKKKKRILVFTEENKTKKREFEPNFRVDTRDLKIKKSEANVRSKYK